MLKYQYFIDTCKNKEQQLPEPCEIAIAEVMIGFSDLEIWFSIKDCSELIDQVKKIWESTEQINYKCKLDTFLHSYTMEIMDVFKKYQAHLEKVKQLQLLENRTTKIYKQDLVDQDREDDIQFMFTVGGIDEFNVVDFQLDNKKYIYSLEISYQKIMKRIQGQVETVAQRLIFNQEVQLDLPIEMGTLQLNLLKESENDQICIAQRNLDPFTCLSDDMISYPFRLMNKDRYLNLQMKIHCMEDIQKSLRQRLKYLKDQYEKLFKKCHKYKIKLTLLLKPFSIIKFDDEFIYLQTIKEKKTNKGCMNCQLF